MRAFKLLISLNGILIIGLVGFYVLMILQSRSLQKEEHQKKEELTKIKEAQQKLDALEKEVAHLRKGQEGVYDLVSLNETNPLKLIKTLTLLGAELGLEKMEFVSEEKKEDGNIASAPPSNNMTATTGMGLQGRGKDNSPVSGSASGNGVKSSNDSLVFTPLLIRMTFEAPYTQLFLFLEKIQTLKRVISIEEIQVNRAEKILPYQEVTLRLVAYTLITEP